MMRIGLRSACLRTPIKKALHIAAQVGAAGVEIDARNDLPVRDMTQTAVRHFRKVLDDLRLTVCSMAFPTRHGYAESDNLQPRIEATQQAMRLAYDLGCSVFVVSSGMIPSTEQTEWSTFLEAMHALARHANHVGVRLQARVAPPSMSEFPTLLEQLPPESIQLALHPAELLRGGESPNAIAAQLGGNVGLLYASDVVRDLATGQTNAVELGRGTVDMPALLGALAEHDYRGWTVVDQLEGTLSVAAAENAVRYLNSL